MKQEFRKVAPREVKKCPSCNGDLGSNPSENKHYKKDNVLDGLVDHIFPHFLDDENQLKGKLTSIEIPCYQLC